MIVFGFITIILSLFVLLIRNDSSLNFCPIGFTVTKILFVIGNHCGRWRMNKLIQSSQGFFVTKEILLLVVFTVLHLDKVKVRRDQVES